MSTTATLRSAQVHAHYVLHSQGIRQRRDPSPAESDAGSGIDDAGSGYDAGSGIDYFSIYDAGSGIDDSYSGYETDEETELPATSTWTGCRRTAHAGCRKTARAGTALARARLCLQRRDAQILQLLEGARGQRADEAAALGLRAPSLGDDEGGGGEPLSYRDWVSVQRAAAPGPRSRSPSRSPSGSPPPRRRRSGSFSSCGSGRTGFDEGLSPTSSCEDSEGYCSGSDDGGSGFDVDSPHTSAGSPSGTPPEVDWMAAAGPQVCSIS